ncbi:hypothetical protein TNCV_1481601 [Trichonephila clavipes]|nr:hypothetical protein TNCV_1481601 [Trichonephila clavipes]
MFNIPSGLLRCDGAPASQSLDPKVNLSEITLSEDTCYSEECQEAANGDNSRSQIILREKGKMFGLRP